MNADVLLLIAYVLMALFFSFLCSVAEAVLLSITPSYIEEQKESKPKLAAILKRLKQDNVDRSLAAILTLNTIAHTVGAIMAGAKATVVFGSTWFGLFSAGMTLLILFLSEIVPKTIGAIYWSKLVKPSALFVNSLIVILYPIVWLSEKFTKFISHGKDLHIFSRTEFLAMARIGGQTGHLSDNESRIIANLFRFSQTRVREVMVPRPRIVALDIEQDRETILKVVLDSQFSRFPVYRGEMDNVLGFVHAKDLLSVAVQTPDFDLGSLLRQAIFLPEAKRVHDLLREIQQGHIHMAMVVDEYGNLSGLVTTEDLLEELVGEIEDEHDLTEPKRVQRLKEGGYLVDALLSLNDLENLLGVRFDDSVPYETLAGLILYELGHLPAEGESLIWRDHRLTCVKVAHTGIRKVKIVSTSGQAEGSEVKA
jgi:CBS domain containing-hemolysin-like protein